MSVLLEIRELTVELATAAGWIRPVNEVSLRIGAGESLGLVGESGSGKTMLSLALMGLLPEGARARGRAALGERQLMGLDERGWRAVRGREIAMIFQEPMTSLNPVMRVGAQIEEAVRAHEAALSAAELRCRSIEALRRAAVPEPDVRAGQFPHQLSGGLRQRAMIAMALAAGPKLLIADEPTTALDVTVQKQVLDLLGTLRRELQLGLLFITHDLGVVAQVAERVAVMYAGRIVEQGPVQKVLTEPRHPYTQGLLRASLTLERNTEPGRAASGDGSGGPQAGKSQARRRLRPIPGTVPQLFALPPGCAFEPRCEFRREECSEAAPELRTVSEQHIARCVLVESRRG